MISIKKIFCLHLNWKEGGKVNFDDYAFLQGKGQIIPWTCTNCGKVKQFAWSNPPINYVENHH